MSFRIRHDESVADALQRAARKELSTARDELRKTRPPGDEAIHEARKSIKKVRAVIDVIVADDGRGLGGSRKRARKVSRTLSRLRDADAMLAIAAKLRNNHPPAFDEHGFARVCRLLVSDKQAVQRAALEDDDWPAVDRTLRALRRKAKQWRPTHTGFAALAKGLRATHREGRKALARAKERQGATDFHEWRKAMKALWYQLRLVEACGPTVARDVRALHQAETWLGDDHNVAILCTTLSRSGALFDIGKLRRAADRFQSDLRRKSMAKTARIYRSQPKAYVRRIERAWKTWRRRDEQARGQTRRAA